MVAELFKPCLTLFSRQNLVLYVNRIDHDRNRSVWKEQFGASLPKTSEKVEALTAHPLLGMGHGHAEFSRLVGMISFRDPVNSSQNVVSSIERD
jgi:hypothetical protein